MLDESKADRPSPEPVKGERKRPNGRQKLKNAASGASGSAHHQSGKSANGNGLSKPESTSLQNERQKKSEGIVEIDEPTGTVKLNSERIFGTDNHDVTQALAQQVCDLVPTVAGKLDSQNLKWALITLSEIGPNDGLERLLAVQMIGVHSLAARCLKRASREDQTPEVMDVNINRATKLMRTFTTQMEALNRHRGKVSHQMVVENVNVNDGGQAIVGPVNRGSSGKASTEDDADKVK